MKYACGHESFAGVGDNCMACHRLHGAKPQEPVKKTGRPVVLTDEQRKENKRNEDKRTSDRRKGSHYFRSRYRRIKGVFVDDDGRELSEEAVAKIKARQKEEAKERKRAREQEKNRRAYRIRNLADIGEFVVVRDGLYLVAAIQRYSIHRKVFDSRDKAYTYTSKRRATLAAKKYGAEVVTLSQIDPNEPPPIRTPRPIIVKSGRYVIRDASGLWRRRTGYKPTKEFSCAKEYRSLLYAERSAKLRGGDVMEKHETEGKTLAAWKAKQMKEKV